MTKQEMNLWGCSIKGIGIRKLLILERELGNVENIYEASQDRLLKIKGISKTDVHNIVKSRETFTAQEFFRRLAADQLNYCTYFDDTYPDLCRQIYDPPKKIFFRGRLPDEKICVAVVGARDCSVYGKECARTFSDVLSAAGVGVISGMARGIDGWAHQGALEGGGRTYAVLGNGADICYPAEHRRLYQSIINHGGVLSEFPPGTKAAPALFPRRNRIISALSLGVLVVEARQRSGSLITAEQAAEQGRDVFVIPGRIGDALSEGCNRLIKQGAYLVTSPEEILEFYGIEKRNKTENCTNINIFLETKEKMVYASLSLEPKHLNVLAEELNWESADVMKCLLSLLKHRLVKEIGNHYYIRNVI